MRRGVTRFGLFLSIALVAGVAPAAATVIDFEATGRGGNLTGIPDSPLTIGIGTFTGGELVNAEVGLNADQNSVYAAQGIFGSGETNPLVITFASPVDGFSVFVANGDDTRSYTVPDNPGDSITKSLPSAGALDAGTLSLPAKGITTVSIASANTDGWHFAIDNVSFTSATSVPEPGSLFVVGAGAILLRCVERKYVKALMRGKASHGYFTSADHAQTV
jgi:hypothetical protein